jgi:hypothetical protein
MSPELHLNKAHMLHPQCKVTPYNWPVPESKVKMLEYEYKDNDLNTRQTKVNMHMLCSGISPKNKVLVK